MANGQSYLLLSHGFRLVCCVLHASVHYDDIAFLAPWKHKHQLNYYATFKRKTQDGKTNTSRLSSSMERPNGSFWQNASPLQKKKKLPLKAVIHIICLQISLPHCDVLESADCLQLNSTVVPTCRYLMSVSQPALRDKSHDLLFITHTAALSVRLAHSRCIRHFYLSPKY